MLFRSPVTHLTTDFGAPVASNRDSLTAGSRGPLLAQDVWLNEKLANFVREVIPERRMHAKGSGAFGTFTVTKDITQYTRAAIFSQVGKQTEMFARFTTVAGERGAADAERDIRGFALKFYTEEGNWDLVGNNTPVFFLRDPRKFADLNKAVKRDPHTNLRSPRPNWCWQMDASVCVIYYLPKGGAFIREMKESEFYSGKPENWNKISGQMVIRYLMTDHRTDMRRLWYVQGAESGEHAADHLIRCMQKPDDPRGMLWGKPVHLMVDPGSAQVGRKFKRLCRRLGIKLIVNKAGNPRAKGQVENGHNLVERDFEHGLKLLSREIRGIDDLNRLADFWQRHFNCNAIHTRYGRDRYSAWAEDVAGHLIAPPPEAVKISSEKNR